MTSHEINNSLGAVSSLLESLATFAPQLEPADREAFGESIEVSRRRLDALAAFTRTIASVVRIPPPSLSPMNLGELLSDLETLLAPELRENRIDFRVVFRDQPLILQADKNQIEQVLVNILRNAIESIGTDGVIEAETLRIHDRVQLKIRDSGQGIAVESETLLFTPFFSTKQDGRGVGLMLVRDILTRHGANFTLRNHPSGGAEFALDFPTVVDKSALRP
jgi:two-component system, NtrC family, nitrogen regulation sensor histidine kinase NtrY